MKRNKLVDYIQDKTGQELNIDYYFIAGTQHPFYDEPKGMISGTNRPGFIVVNKHTKKEKSFTITTDNLETYQNEIVEFLKTE